ncbi:hypothetical protein Poly24_09520 [Rosistilla carotiformis]|uniref:Uncharacterized protein n=1 Tax=Rosistilla carotiformis TaxID=2528017 RepID=A0A518JNY7_9BACT|nr:hypothetical protein Poly24_09520 [Rosistilla carotiformis]
MRPSFESKYWFGGPGPCSSRDHSAFLCRRLCGRLRVGDSFCQVRIALNLGSFRTGASFRGGEFRFEVSVEQQFCLRLCVPALVACRGRAVCCRCGGGSCASIRIGLLAGSAVPIACTMRSTFEHNQLRGFVASIFEMTKLYPPPANVGSSYFALEYALGLIVTSHYIGGVPLTLRIWDGNAVRNHGRTKIWQGSTSIA